MKRSFQVQCLKCKHVYWKKKDFMSSLTCKAYPNGIPEEIIHGKVNHRKPYKGDNGIQFESIE